MNVLCSSPTCAAGLNLPGAETAPPRLLAAGLDRLGWKIEQQHDDDQARPYCPRCSTV